MLEFLRAVAESYGQLGLVVKVSIVVGIFLATTAFGIAVVVFLPADHFVRGPEAVAWRHQHPVLRWTGLAIKNLLGFVVLLLGIVMAVPPVPGPGLVFMLVGLSLLDFPGKRRLERRLLGFPNVRRFLNQVRERFGKPPLRVE